MSKYIKLEDAIEQIRTVFYKDEYQEWLAIAVDNLINRTADLPTIDIVHCKDCRWSKSNREGDYDCKCHIPIFRVPEDGWCYLGERTGE